MSSLGMSAGGGGAGRLLGRFFALAATIGFAAAVADIFDQGGAWWHYALVLCLWLALLAFALMLIPTAVGGLLQRIVRARNAAQDAVQAGRPVEPFLQRTVDPASGIRLPNVLRLIALAFTAIALILGAAGGIIALSRTIFLERAAVADGVVAEMLPAGARHGVPQRPRIEFTTPDAVTRTLVSGIKTWPPRYARGDRVTVFYDPKRPAHAYPDSGFDLWFVPILVGGLGAAFMIPALVLFLLAFRFTRRAAAPT
jgi:hypothetical protein